MRSTPSSNLISTITGWIAWLRPGPTLSPLEAIMRARERQVRVDYRDRISMVTWLIVFGLGASLFFQLPNVPNISFTAFRTPVTLALTDSLIAAAFLATLAAAGTQSVIGVHPFLNDGTTQFWRSWAFWALPMALTIISAYLLPLAPNRLTQVLALLIVGALTALALFCLYATVERGQAGFRRGRLILNALAYGSALMLFLLVYQTRTRSLISATVIAVTAMLLAIEILRSTTERTDLILSYGAICGIVLGQVTWALNYWPLLPGLTGGLLLLLIFYLFVGVAQQGLQERFNARILVEFAVFTVIALLLIAVVGPGY